MILGNLQKKKKKKLEKSWNFVMTESGNPDYDTYSFTSFGENLMILEMKNNIQ